MGPSIEQRLTRRRFLSTAGAVPLAAAGCARSSPQPPDTVWHNGNIATLDPRSSRVDAIAVRNGRIFATGTDGDMLALSGPGTVKRDLDGATVVPGLIEGHAHPERASLSERGRPLPNPRTVSACLDWIASEADRLPAGTWIIHPKLFPTRLRDLRPPSLAELDSTAPAHPIFLNAAYGGSINTAAMRASGIDIDSADHPGLLRDPATGRLNGRLINTAFGLLKLPRGEDVSDEEQARALTALFRRYNSVGFTGVVSGGMAPAGIALYRTMRDDGRLTVRVAANIYVRFPFIGRGPGEIAEELSAYGMKTGDGDEWVRVAALKTTMDGGILTGTACLREPWGDRAAEVFGIEEPGYRGGVRMTADDFASLAGAGADAGWKMTAHCTGGGGVDLMLDAYDTVGRTRDIGATRSSIIHANFFTQDAARRAAGLGVIADMQPAWLFKDGDMILDVLGPRWARTFHPYRTLIDAGVIVNAGSDHMVILDDVESINPYNPWLAMAAMVTRRTERGTIVFPEEAVTRGEALRCYTANNAFATFEEDIKGSLEPGKLADFVVLDRDFFTCPAEEIGHVRPVMTVVGGEVVYEG